jgi:hypothetical protein
VQLAAVLVEHDGVQRVEQRGLPVPFEREQCDVAALVVAKVVATALEILRVNADIVSLASDKRNAPCC